MSSRVRRRPLVVTIATFATVVIVSLAFRTTLLSAAGWTLIADDRLMPADVIVVPQWAGNAGALEAVDLVHEGFSSHVAVLLAPSDAARQELKRRGIPVREFEGWLTRVVSLQGVSVEEIPNRANGTEAEGDLLPEWCAANHVRSVIVVSTPDHSRRVRRVLQRSMKGRGIIVIVHPEHYSQFDPDRWWKTRDGVRTEIVEFEKLALDILRHPLG